MTSFKTLINYTVVGICGAIIGYFFIQPKTKIIEKEKLVYVEKKEEKKDSKVTTIIREEKKPDGTIITDTTKTEETKTETKTEVAVQKEKTKKTENNSGVIIGAMIMDELNDLKSKDDYGILVAIPIAKRAYLFSTMDTQKRFGVGLALEF
jgi:flagellar biosynthesis protein FliP